MQNVITSEGIDDIDNKQGGNMRRKYFKTSST